MPEVLVLTGPTACGKTEAALILAERLGAEIVSVDSMKVYRGMDIGTAKPSPEERARVRHHLIDIRDPWETYTAHEFVRDADAAVREIASRGRRVLLEGGTPMYLKAFLDGLFEGAGTDADFRRALDDEAERLGLVALHDRLTTLDPVAAARIHPNDRKRIYRALEVRHLTGRPISELQRQFGRRRQGVKARVAMLDRPRDVIRERVARRVDAMLASGFVEEARRLRSLGRPVSRTAAGALGYAELWAFIDGDIDLAEARRRIIAGTNRFVRKQLTWLRSFDDLVRVESAGDAARDAERIEAAWKGLGDD